MAAEAMAAPGSSWKLSETDRRPSKMPRRRKHHHDHRCSKEPKANKYDRQDKSDGGKAKDKT